FLSFRCFCCVCVFRDVTVGNTLCFVLSFAPHPPSLFLLLLFIASPDFLLSCPFTPVIGVRQGCLLSPVLFNLYLKSIMREALEGHHTSISIGGRPLCNLRFADDIDLMGGSNQELQMLTDKMVDRAEAYGMEVSSDKSKVTVNSNDNNSVNIAMYGKQPEEAEGFKYFGSTITKDDRCTAEIKSRIAIATSAMSGLSKIWRAKEISFKTKLKLYKSLVLSIFLYGCESWTLTADHKNAGQMMSRPGLVRV
uniref:Reverse transcriptase domain-containing protein n=1 Tax=Amphilophus citrinellus TaxID=61819 RepID=A0A3Q0RSH2_AMPCI